MTTEQLSGRLLDEAIALASGWTRHQIDDPSEPAWWYCPPGHVADHHTHYAPPAYSSSVDALREPEAKVREAGYYLSVSVFDDQALAVWDPTTLPSKVRIPRLDWSPTEAEARARAVLAALQALAMAELTTPLGDEGTPFGQPAIDVLRRISRGGE